MLGSILLGWHPIGYVEWDDYCQRVIAARIRDGILPDAPIFGDIKTFISEGYAESYQGLVDVITGGFPCQDISCAGKGAGIEGERSGLWKEMATTIRIIRPSYVFVENSPMLTTRGLGTILRDLAEMGFDARWGCVSAANVGAPFKRERIFIVAFSDGGHGKEGMGSFQNREGKVQQRAYFKMLRDLWIQTIDSNAGKHNGDSNYLDRGRAVGNMQVPIVAATAWRILTQ